MGNENTAESLKPKFIVVARRLVADVVKRLTPGSRDRAVILAAIIVAVPSFVLVYWQYGPAATSATAPNVSESASPAPTVMVAGSKSRKRRSRSPQPAPDQTRANPDPLPSPETISPPATNSCSAQDIRLKICVPETNVPDIKSIEEKEKLWDSQPKRAPHCSCQRASSQGY